MSKETDQAEDKEQLGVETNDEPNKGTKMKMPAAQLAQVTKAKKKLDELLDTDCAFDDVNKSMQKFEDEVTKLEKQCGLILTLDEEQEKHKSEWMSKNVVHLRGSIAETKKRISNKFVSNVVDALSTKVPRVVIDLPSDEDKASRKSKLSRKSNASSRARQAEAEAEVLALQIERDRLQKRQAQENEERLLRQQREQEDLDAKIEQARVRQEALSKAGSRASSRVSSVSDFEVGSQRRRLLNLPSSPQRTSEWIGNTTAVSQQASHPHQSTFQARSRPFPEPNLTQQAGMSTQLCQQMLLPSSKLPVFKGSYLDFPWFIRSFEMLVEDVTTDPTRRLHLLLQHLEGEPHTLVKGFHLAEPTLAFQLAKQELVQRYGNPIRQSLAFKDQLLSWPPIRKDVASDLEKFFVQLRLCEAMKQSGGNMSELDSPSALVRLMYKLPQRNQDSWQRRVYRIESTQGRQTTYSDFTQFVKELAETANHPVFGRQASQVKTASTKVIPTMLEPDEEQAVEECMATTRSVAPKSGPDRSNVNANEQKDAFQAPCLVCEGAHSTADCKSYDQVALADRKIKLKGLCFRCLKSDHWARNCRAPATCDICEGRHPTLLHDEERATKNSKAASSNSTTANNETCGATVSASPGAGSIAAVPVKVWLTSSRSPIVTLAILDTASSASFVSEALAAKLGVKVIKDTHLQLSTVVETSGTSTAIIRGLRVADVDGNNSLDLPPVYTIRGLPACTESEVLRKEVAHWKHLQRVPFAWDQYEGKVGLLIGQDVPDALCPEMVVRGDGPNEPFATLTPLGWTFNGPKDASTRNDECVNLAQSTKAVIDDGDDIALALQRLFYSGLDDLFNFHSKGPSLDDRAWLSIIESSVRRSATHPTRYEIALPFRPGVNLLNNRQQAERQLVALRRRFATNSQFHTDYVAFITKMEQAGYVEPVTNLDTDQSLTFYVPHHGVYHPRKPGKIRVVFNCSSKYHGVSLNDCLLSGPDLTNSLLGVLLRFRQESVAFVADVESMFYRVLVPNEQRDALRYLWWPDGDVTRPPKTYRMTVHLFGATSSPSCANYALRKAADDAYNDGKVTIEVRDAVHNNFYVDDCLKSVSTEEEAVDTALGLIKSCQYGGFKLTKFVSTSSVLLKALPADRLARAIEQTTLEDKHNPLLSWQERALGVAWDVTNDYFHFKLSPCPLTKITRRSILSMLSMVYDPIGMASPVVITARVLFRELTKGFSSSKRKGQVQAKGTISWDDSVEETKASEWAKWLTDLPQIQSVRLPRCYRRSVEPGKDQWQLHAFCDSSLDAYSAVIYLRHGEVSPAITYLMGKARVTPPKTATIPRLELVAAKLATDMMVSAQKELQLTISRRIYWSDSQTVLKYLNCKTRRFHTFVTNRVHSILSSSSPDEWHFVPSSLNPADEATRGLRAPDLATSKWLNGPDFLSKPEDNWPQVEQLEEPELNDPEVKDAIVVQTNASSSEITFISTLAARYSSAHRFRKAVAIWLKYKTFLLKGDIKSRSITANDLLVTELAAIKWSQHDSFPEEIRSLDKGEQVKRASLLWKLSPGLMNGLLVMRSRARVNLPIVPSGPLANLIIIEAHHQQLHFGRNYTSAAVLKKWWIIGLNKAVRRLIRACPSCQRRRTLPQPEEMGALPKFRINVSNHAFSTTGIDYFGPFDVQHGARSTKKVYGIVFTSAATRAVHLEAAEDLTSSEFVNALRRFFARRGPVQNIITDNGTNFKGARRELSEELKAEIERQRNDNAAILELRRQGIEWTLNAPGASHHGGIWERLIRSIRQAFEAILNVYRPLTITSFYTLLCEVEAVLNARPLTSVSEDPLDLEALTPNHLLLMRSGPEPQLGDFSATTVIRRHWRHVQHLSQIFWKRWVHEYRTTLHRRTTLLAKNARPMRVGDIVLVMDPLHHRRYWKLGRVLRIESSDCKQPRTVEVQTQNGTFVRPITKLCLLETASQND